jgi:hypothetical protein
MSACIFAEVLPSVEALMPFRAVRKFVEPFFLYKCGNVVGRGINSEHRAIRGILRLCFIKRRRGWCRSFMHVFCIREDYRKLLAALSFLFSRLPGALKKNSTACSRRCT